MPRRGGCTRCCGGLITCGAGHPLGARSRLANAPSCGPNAGSGGAEPASCSRLSSRVDVNSHLKRRDCALEIAESGPCIAEIAPRKCIAGVEFERGLSGSARFHPFFRHQQRGRVIGPVRGILFVKLAGACQVVGRKGRKPGDEKLRARDVIRLRTVITGDQQAVGATSRCERAAEGKTGRDANDRSVIVVRGDPEDVGGDALRIAPLTKLREALKHLVLNPLSCGSSCASEGFAV